MSFAAVGIAAAAVAEGVAAAAAAASAAAAAASAAVAGTVAAGATAAGASAGTAATIGATVAGAGQGALAGAALGAATSAATGGDVGKGALYGAAGGALTGGASSALGAAGGAKAGTAAGASTSAAPAAGPSVAGEGLYGSVAKEGGLASARVAGENAVNPAFESAAGKAATTPNNLTSVGGNTTGSMIDSGPLTPGFGSGEYSGIGGSSSPGMLGTAGTNAADISTGSGAVNPGFSSMSAPKSNPAINGAKYLYNVNGNSNSIRQLAGDSQETTDRNNAIVNDQASELAQNSLNSIVPYQDDNRNRISSQIFMNNWKKIK